MLLWLVGRLVWCSPAVFSFTNHHYHLSLEIESAFPFSVVTFHMFWWVVRVVASSSPKPKGEPRGMTKPPRVSEELQSLLGVPEIPRRHALKPIWAYIKDNNLQDPSNKKIIICDEKLKMTFGRKDRVGFLEIAGLINPHLLR